MAGRDGVVVIWKPEIISPPEIVRQAELPIGSGFMFAGRPLTVVKTYGTDPSAPVILEERASFGGSIAGQYALWSYAAVFGQLYGRKP